MSQSLDSTPMQVELRVHPSLSEISEAAWQALLAENDNPFVSWAFLEGLESTGCVVPDRGWWPCHLALWQKSDDEADELLAAAPAYVKNDGMGDFSRDWGMFDLVQRFGVDLYPKLVVGAPFSPVPGPRILCRPGTDRVVATRLLMELATEVARGNELSSVHVLYHLPEERPALEAAGLATRVMVQYHWHDYGYRSFDDWLATFPSRKRKQIRRERRALGDQGIDIRTVRGAQIEGDPWGWADEAFDLYCTTCAKYMWGGTYLNRDFFRLLFDRMPDRIWLVEARRQGRLVAGALELATDTHLYGRYWGCHEEHQFLHFNVCIYHGVDECIEHGLRVFEGGAGGEHKYARGFEPRAVYTSHRFLHPRLDEVMARALEVDARSREDFLERWREENRPGEARAGRPVE